MSRAPGPGVPFYGGLAAAVLVSRAPAVSQTALLGLACAASSLACSLSRTPWSHSAPGRSLPRLVLCAALAGLAAGAAIGAAPGARPRLGLAASDVRSFRGIALEDSVATTGGGRMHRLSLREVSSPAGRASASGTVRLLCSGEEVSYVGQSVTVTGRLEAQAGWSGDDFFCRVRASDLRPGGFASTILRLRRVVRERLDERVRQMGYPVSAFFLAMFIGDRAGVTEELSALFRDAGASHVLALSGTHLMLVYGIAAFLLRRLPWARARILLPLGLTMLYLLLAGPLPSLVRAAAMLLVAVAARGLDRQTSGVDLLCLAGSAVLLVEPRMLFDLSYELSFLAVAGMVTVGTAVADRLARFLPRSICVSVSAAAGAQAAVTPILLGTFGAFQPVGLVSGLLIAPLSTVFLVVGLVELALPLGLPAAVHASLGAAHYATYRLLEEVLRFFARSRPSRSWLAAAAIWAVLAAIIAARPLLRRRARP